MKFYYYAKERNNYIRKTSLLAKNNLLTFLEVAKKILNLTLFSKHQVDSTTHLDLKTSYPHVSVQNYYINISATFPIMSTLAKPNAI